MDLGYIGALSPPVEMGQTNKNRLFPTYFNASSLSTNKWEDEEEEEFFLHYV